MDLHLDEEVLDFLAEKGYDPKYGARQLQRSIQRQLIIPLAKELNLLDYDDQLVVRVAVDNDRLAIKVEVDPLGLDLLLEELDKINYADHASGLRRQIARFREGHFYNRLMSQLDILEREKTKSGKRFWQNGPKSTKYTQLLKTQERLGELSQEIEELEERLSKACLALQSYNPQLTDAVKSWEEKMLQLKLDLYSQYLPEGNTCYLAIFGTRLQAILDFYLRLFRSKEYSWEAQTIWFRESHYHEALLALDNGNADRVTKDPAYIEKDFEKEGTQNFQAPQAGDLLYGIVFKVKGKGAYLFLNEEDGLQRWKLSEKEELNYHLLVEDKALDYPLNIHRRDFYKGNPRRTVEAQFFKDTRLKIKRELDFKNLLSTLLELLEKQFISKLNTELN